MARLRSTIGQLIAYTLYGLVVFGAVLYLTLPYDQVLQRLNDRLAQRGIQLVAADVGPAFPPGLQARDVRLRLEQWAYDAPVVRLTTLRAQPKLIPLLSGKLHVRFVGTLYSGQLQGVGRYMTGDDSPGWEIEASFNGLNVAQHPFLQRDGQPFLHGQLDVGTTATLAQDGQLQTGTITLQARALTFTGQVLKLPLQQDIVCTTVDGNGEITSQQADKVSFSCMGDDLTVGASGTVQWRSPLRNSVANLRWQLRSETTYQSEITLIGSLVGQRLKRPGELSLRMYGPFNRLRSGA